MRETFSFLKPIVIKALDKDAKKAEAPGHANGKAGDKSTDYWRLEFRAAIDERVGKHMDAQSDILQEIRDGIRELVTIARLKS